MPKYSKTTLDIADTWRRWRVEENPDSDAARTKMTTIQFLETSGWAGDVRNMADGIVTRWDEDLADWVKEQYRKGRVL